MRFNLRSTSAGSCARDATDCIATLIIEGDKRSRDTVSADVRHKDTHTVLVHLDEFVEIARYGTHGLIASGHSEVLDFRNTGRKDRGLCLPRNL